MASGSGTTSTSARSSSSNQDNTGAGVKFSEATTTSSIDSLASKLFPPLTEIALALPQTPWFDLPYTSPMVTIVVGGPQSPAQEPIPVRFSIHKDILTTNSEFFRVALRSQDDRHSQPVSWNEGKQLEVRLPEDRIDDFTSLVKWFYWQASHQANDQGTTGVTRTTKLAHATMDQAVLDYLTWKTARSPPKTIVVNESGITLVPQAVTIKEAQNLLLPRPGPPVFTPLIRLYILADKYGINVQLKKMVCDKLMSVARGANSVPNMEDIFILYESIPPKAELQESRAHRPKARPKVKKASLTVIETETQIDSTDLKQVIVRMYKNLGKKTLPRMLHPHMKPEELERSSGWHPDFMLDLVKALAADRVGFLEMVSDRECGKQEFSQYAAMVTKDSSEEE